MKARGLQDILITATDNLNGFTQTIRSVFPESATQICVVHQIRNSCRYVVWKDKKEFSRDMKDIYAAPKSFRKQAQVLNNSMEIPIGQKFKVFRSRLISFIISLVENATYLLSYRRTCCSMYFASHIQKWRMSTKNRDY